MKGPSAVIFPWKESSGPLCHEAGSFTVPLMVRALDGEMSVLLSCDRRYRINPMYRAGEIEVGDGKTTHSRASELDLLKSDLAKRA